LCIRHYGIYFWLGRRRQSLSISEITFSKQMIVVFIKWLLFCLIAVVYFFGKVKIIYYKKSKGSQYCLQIYFTNIRKNSCPIAVLWYRVYLIRDRRLRIIILKKQASASCLFIATVIIFSLAPVIWNHHVLHSAQFLP